MRPGLWLIRALTIALAAGPTAARAESPGIAESTAADLVAGRYPAVAARFAPAMRSKIGPTELAAVVEPLRRVRGPARKMRIISREGDATQLEIDWSRGAPSELEVTLAGDRIAGMLIHDLPSAAVEPKVTVALRPPFAGTWTALNANRDAQNPHYLNPNQRYAVDWVIRDARGKTYRTDGAHNQDYYAWRKEALAPAAGTVVIVVDGVPENPTPGQGDDYNLIGNHVVLDLGGRVFALFAHLVPGSIRVRVGDRVRPGQPIGAVGNSGHSTEPHLHFQLMDHPRLTEAHSLPARFARVLVDGTPTTNAWPKSGDRVSALAPEPPRR